METLYDCKILVVDDETALCDMIAEMLTQAGFRTVRTVQSCAAAREQFTAFAPDAVLLDVMLPDGDGFSLMRTLRHERDVPILFLSARDADEDRLHGLGLGADDYIVKPFLPQELVLRLQAVLRRAYATRLQENSNVLRMGETVVDWGSGTVTRDGQTVSLTAKEYALLRKLAANRGNIVTIDALCNAVWEDGSFGYENTLMVHIRRLREKIEDTPSVPRWLLTVRGLGYRLAKEEAR
ncbi:MAG TPA: response regulator transcription factor [Candidatus Agathobaculum pullicola]|nr:response regulator transcription factor [Candidatus Agathobaculum pullicola]